MKIATLLFGILLFSSCKNSANENFIGTWIYQPSLSAEGYSPDKDKEMQGITITIKKCENTSDAFFLDYLGSEIILTTINTTTLKSINEKYPFQKGSTTVTYDNTNKQLILNQMGYHEEYLKIK